MPRITVCIPSYNQERYIGLSIVSAKMQKYHNLEILVIDDASTDSTADRAREHNVNLIINKENLGLAGNLDKLVNNSTGRYIIILCGDDILTNDHVIEDMVKMFESNKAIGVVGRYFYQHLEDNFNPVMQMRGNIYLNSCQPSGMAFRRSALQGKFSDKIFVEVPSMVKRIIDNGWGHKTLKYDTIAARLHLGENPNAAADPSYYAVGDGQSISLNWTEIMGEPRIYYYGFIQLKNRFPKMLLREILISVKLKPTILFDLLFWVFALASILVPSFVLRELANWYRTHITSRYCKVIRRP